MNRQTKIICTLGPATRRPALVKGLIEAGMDYARLNFSHGAAKEHIELAQIIRAMAEKVGREVKIMQDLEGPKLRIGEMNQPLHLNQGDKIWLGHHTASSEQIPFPNEEVLALIQDGDHIFLDDGAVELLALKTDRKEVECLVIVGGQIDSHSGFQLAGRSIDLPALSEKDYRDIETGRKIGVDVVAQSMVRDPGDLKELANVLGESIPIVAKIEDSQALGVLDSIAERAWGLMVARGDLGVSIPRAQVPLWQKEILATCKKKDCQGIVATEMLLSMVTRERPTRAEVSDVATALFDGANAVMLSEETAIGQHPLTVVREIRTIIETVEASRWYHS